jgi:hypothetical protein
MNTLKTVYSKLFKEETTNLASHEVELGAIQDLEKLIANAQKDLDLFNKNSKELKTLAKWEKNLENPSGLIFFSILRDELLIKSIISCRIISQIGIPFIFKSNKPFFCSISLILYNLSFLKSVND